MSCVGDITDLAPKALREAPIRATIIGGEITREVSDASTLPQGRIVWAL